MKVFDSLRKKIGEFKLTMGQKLTLSLSAIAVTLLTSSVISILEYSSMSNYVSELIADNINSLNVAQRLSTLTNEYNLEILAVVGDDSRSSLPDFNQKEFLDKCDSLRAALSPNNLSHLADSVMYSYSAYMLSSLELPEVLSSESVDSRQWYFERLQSFYNRLHTDITTLSGSIYNMLQRNSAVFERGFYRSIIPGAVAVGVGLVLVLLLLFFILVYYVKPINGMLKGISEYINNNGKRYNYDFEGDDQLRDLNSAIREVTEENRQLKKRSRTIVPRQTKAE